MFYCLDTNPTTPAAYDQIIEVVTKADPDRRAIWRSFREALIGEILLPIETEAIDPKLLEEGWIRFDGAR